MVSGTYGYWNHAGIASIFNQTPPVAGLNWEESQRRAELAGSKEGRGGGGSLVVWR